jgi:glutaryl-CoA dehydrogenase
VVDPQLRVPEENRLQEANGFKDTARVLKMTRAGVAWSAVGCARGAYEHALAYALEREQFGRPIGGFQLVQDLLVRMLGNITASACLCARLSQLQTAGLARDEHASLAKAFCTVRMRETVGWARELLGGNGILLEHHVGLGQDAVGVILAFDPDIRLKPGQECSWRLLIENDHPVNGSQCI